MSDYTINEKRLLEYFIELAKINAPSGHEKPIADFIVPHLKGLGFTIEFDEAHNNFGGNCGNLIAYWPGTNPDIKPLFFSTHMDTVFPTEGLNPIIKDGVIYTDGKTILGADDRAALAAYIEAVRSIREKEIECGPIELVLTVNEQPGLVGATYLDYSKVKSTEGYIFDSSGDVGQIIQQGPYSSRIYSNIQGRSSHLGLNPEEGINAFLIASRALLNMKLGKIDSETVANIGEIEGVGMSSIIPGEVSLVGEVRSLSEKGLQNQLNHMNDVISEAAESYGGKTTTRIEKKYLGFHHPTDSVLVQNALEATSLISVDNYVTQTFGGADTNIFNENGLSSITLGNGFRNIHTVDEHISIENLNNTARFVIALATAWCQRHK